MAHLKHPTDWTKLKRLSIPVRFITRIVCDIPHSLETMGKGADDSNPEIKPRPAICQGSFYGKRQTISSPQKGKYTHLFRKRL